MTRRLFFLALVGSMLFAALVFIFSPPYHREYLKLYQSGSAPTCKSDFNPDGSLKLMACLESGAVPLTICREAKSDIPLRTDGVSVIRCNEHGALIHDKAKP